MRRFLLALLAIPVLACGSDGTAPQQGFGGDYVLETINGQSLPYTWTFASGGFYRLDSYRFSIIPASGDVTVEGSWISSLSYAYTDQGQVINRPNGSEVGTYTYLPSADFVSLLSQDETTFFVGDLSADRSTLTSEHNGEVWIFKRQ